MARPQPQARQINHLSLTDNNNNNKKDTNSRFLNDSNTQLINNSNLHHDDNADSSNSWHWLHYHKNGPNRPLFMDYDTDLLLDANDAKLSPNLPRPIIKRQQSNAQTDPKLKLSSPTTNQKSNFDHLAQLSCDSGEMILRLNFTDPFKGIVYPDHNRLSPCRFFGDSHHNYELRLPLRSCGTRQVAPRIFVNDVIVRFHKSLELEEDEIKTLICRYPPPLALQATQSYGQGLVHGLEPAGSPQTSGVEQRRPLPPYEPTSTGQQFELIEPTSGQRSPTAGSISQIELLPIGNQFGGSTGGHRMAPGQQHPSKTINQQLFDDNPQLQQQQFPFGRQKNANIIGLPGTDQVAQSESGGASMIGRIITGNGSAGSNSFNQKQRTTGMLDRLTSIELLFLISSLMFLILLAVGLLGAYYCVKRRRRRRPSSTQTASAILRRKRRYLSPNGSGIHRASLAPPEVVITNDHHLYAPGHQPGSRSYYHTPAGLNQQHQIGAAGRDRFYNGSQLQLHPVEASSPESDQSGHQVLLPTAKSQQQQQQTHMLPIRRHQNTNQLVYDNQPAAAGHQQMNNGAAGGTAPVLGRRAESGGVAYATAGPALGRGHQQQQHLATNLNQYQAAAGLAGRRHQQPTTGGGRSSATTRHQPLLQMVGRPNQKSNQFEQPFSQFNTIGRLNNAGAETTNWPNKNPDHKHHHEHNLARTKSMQQLQPMPNPSDPFNGWRSLSRAGATTTLKHQGTGGNGRHRGQAVGRPRQMVVKTASIMRPRPLPTAADHHYDHQKHHQLINYNDDDDGEFQVSSDSEIELHQAGSNRLPLSSGGTKIAGHHMPRLYLKSIEDRFITNVTEINEQEYVKQDSRKILSWTQWRAMQPTTTTTTFGKPAGDKSKNSDATDDKKANNASRLILDDNDEDDDVQSNQANLRSLTELDVNYAKSLLLNPDGTAIRHQQTGNSQVTMIKSDPKESAPADANKAQTTTTTQATRGTGQSFDPKQDPGKQESHLKGDLVEKLIKIPVRNKAQLALQDKQQLATTNTHQTDDKLQRAQTSDLIISPEYECDPTADDYRRLKLTSSPTSQDSVSYV